MESNKMVSLKRIIGGLHRIHKGVSGVDNCSASKKNSVNEVEVWLGVGKKLHILRLEKGFKLTYYNGNSAVEAGDVYYEQLKNASLGHRIRCGKWNFQIPDSQKHELARILA